MLVFALEWRVDARLAEYAAASHAQHVRTITTVCDATSFLLAALWTAPYAAAHAAQDVAHPHAVGVRFHAPTLQHVQQLAHPPLYACASEEVGVDADGSALPSKLERVTALDVLQLGNISSALLDETFLNMSVARSNVGAATSTEGSAIMETLVAVNLTTLRALVAAHNDHPATAREVVASRLACLARASCARSFGDETACQHALCTLSAQGNSSVAAALWTFRGELLDFLSAGASPGSVALPPPLLPANMAFIRHLDDTTQEALADIAVLHSSAIAEEPVTASHAALYVQHVRAAADDDAAGTQMVTTTSAQPAISQYAIFAAAAVAGVLVLACLVWLLRIAWRVWQ
ncbi:MAG: hypothetical protein EOO41_03795, partial [Methanobacteriota archaeon]